MRTFARMGLLLALSATAVSVAARDPFRVPEGRPSSMRQVDDVLRGDDPQRSIPAYLEGAMCGGWDKDIEVGGYIAQVQGLPGRRHDWAGDIRSGMGTRIDADGNQDPDDDYEFPNSTEGLSTACDKETDRVVKEVFLYAFTIDTMDGPVDIYEQQFNMYDHPYFEDPPCQWRIEGGRWPDVPLQPNPENFYRYDKDAWEFEAWDSCRDFCGYLNEFVYHTCLEPEEVDVRIFDGFDEDGNEQWHWERVQSCAFDDDGNVREGERYICTDEEVHWDVHPFTCDVAQDDLEEWANARRCEGEGCRCPNEENPDACWWAGEEDDKNLYESYYRKYPMAMYSRDALRRDDEGNDLVPEDVSEKQFQTTCFGFYDEFDPKTHRTEAKDRRCVINVNVEDMHETQKGKGTYTEDDVEDADPTDPTTQRPGGPDDEPGEFDPKTDTWYKKLGTAFSFVNEQLFEDRYAQDLGNVFLAYDELDDGEQQATPQINEQTPFAESNLMRAFDDTGNPRAYTRWWQEQQTRMAALLRPPVLRIVMPSAWFMGLDPDDPFLTTVAGSAPAMTRADRADRIELQVEADEDVLGTALAYLERSVLLHVEEEPIQVVVPMGSPAEFRARAADWCNWYKATEGEKTCDDAPENVKKLMERLEEYAQRIDDYRELRAELAETAGAVLDLQYRLLDPIAEWFRTHEQQLRQIVQGRDRAERDLLPIWRSAQASVARMHERTNLPWCMNQRFTSPTYSMLDPWLPSRERDDAPTMELDLPTLPLVERPQDVIIDFSAVAAMSGTLKIPVLKPVQIQVRIPSPPTPEELPELPPVATIRAAMNDVLGKMPDVVNQLQTPPSMEPPPPLDDSILGNARDALAGIARVVGGMNERYEKFWASIGPLKPLDPDHPAYEEQLKEKEKKEEMKCEEWDTMPCEHVEMDLMERAQRIGSRPLVQLKQDFESVGTRRAEATVCLPEDDACHILNAERTDPGFRWEVRGSRENEAPIEELKLTILKVTQPPPLGTVDERILWPHDDDPAPLQAFPRIRLTP